MNVVSPDFQDDLTELGVWVLAHIPMLGRAQFSASQRLISKGMVDEDGKTDLCVLRLAVHFEAQAGLLRPVESDSFRVVGEIFVEIADGAITSITSNGGVSILPSYVGSSGVLISCESISVNAAKLEMIAKSARIEVELGTVGGGALSLITQNAVLDEAGITALVTASQPGSTEWDAAAKKFKGTLSASMGGFAIAIEKFDLTLVKNQLMNAAGTGKFMLPFFDQPLALGIGLLPGGEWSLTIPAPLKPIKLGEFKADESLKDPEPQPAPPKNAGLLELLDVAAKLTIDSLTFQGAGIAVPKIAVNGKLDLSLFGRSASFPLNGLRIDAKGAVDLVSGWLPLPGPVSLDIGPFSATVSRLGFGTTPGGKQITVDAAINLHEAVPIGVSAKGLRVDFDNDWQPQGVSFDGIGVRLVVPEVIDFAGAVAMETKGKEVSFSGDIGVDLLCIDARMDGQIAFGEAADESGDTFRYMAIHLAMDLKSGIKLFSTGLSIYGFEGMFAWNYAPNKAKDEGWYSIEGKDWFHKAPPGIASLSKWAPKPGTLAVGAGVTLGTTGGDGKPFNGKFLLLVTMPGPVVFLEGRANFLKDRSELNKEPLFHALATLDNLAGTVQLGLDVHWREPSKGQLVDLKGGAEAFFDYHNPASWYLKVGQETPTKARVQAKLLSFLQANAFMLVDATHARFGAGAALGDSFSWGPLSAGVKVEVATLVDISWRPAQLQAEASLYGKAWLKAFGYGLSLQVNAGASIHASKPFLLTAKVGVKGELPFYGDYSKTIHIKWTAPKGETGPKDPLAIEPPITCPLVSISAGHRLAPTRWTFAPGVAMVPAKLADEANNLLPDDGSLEAALAEGVVPGTPVLPLDATFDVCFVQAVADNAKIGLAGVQTLPDLAVGDPERSDPTASVKASLTEVVLERWDATKKLWTTVHVRSEGATSSATVDGIWGVWAPAEGDEAAQQASLQQRLRLWEADPLQFLDSPSGEAVQVALSAPILPFVPIVPTKSVLLQMAYAEALTMEQLSSRDTWQPWSSELSPILRWNNTVLQAVRGDPGGDDEWGVMFLVAKRFTELSYLDTSGEVHFGDSAKPTIAALTPVVELDLCWDATTVSKVRLRVASSANVYARGFYGAQPLSCTGQAASGWIELSASAMDRVHLMSIEPLGVEQVEVVSLGTDGTVVAQKEEAVQQAQLNQGILTTAAHLLPAWSDLRLRVKLKVEQKRPNTQPVERIVQQMVRFRTEGPPCMANLAVPPSPSNPTAPDPRQALSGPSGFVNVYGVPTPAPSAFQSKLNTLSPYVLRAYPPAPGPGDSSTAWRLNDVGFDLSLGHVRDMYRLAHSDLGIRVRHLSGAPLRDQQGLPIGVLLDDVWLAEEPAAPPAEFGQLVAGMQLGTAKQLPTQLGVFSRVRWRGPTLPENASLLAELVPMAVVRDQLWQLEPDVPAEAGAVLSGLRWQALGAAGSSSALSQWVPGGEGGAKWLRPPLGSGVVGDIVGAGRMALWKGHGATGPSAQWHSVRASTLLWLGGSSASSGGWLGLAVRASLTGGKGTIVALSAATSQYCVWHRSSDGAKPVLMAQGHFIRTAPSVWLTVLVDEQHLVVLVNNEELHRSPVARFGGATTDAAGYVGLWGQVADAQAKIGFVSLRVEDTGASAPVALSYPFKTGRFASLGHLAAVAPIRPEAQTGGLSDALLDWPSPGSTAVPGNGLVEKQPDRAEVLAARTLQDELAKRFVSFSAPAGDTAVVSGVTNDEKPYIAMRTDRLLDWRRFRVGFRHNAAPRFETRPRFVRILGAQFAVEDAITSIDLMPLGAAVEGPVRLQWLGIANPAWQASGATRLSSQSSDEAAGLLLVSTLSAAELPLWRGSVASGGSGAATFWESTLTGKAFSATQLTSELRPLLAPCDAASDVIVRASFSIQQAKAGVGLRAAAPDEAGGVPMGIQVVWDAQSGQLQVEQTLRDGTKVPTTLAPASIPAGALDLEVVASGSDVLVYANGRLVGVHADPSPQGGSVGICACAIPAMTGKVSLTSFTVQSARGALLRNRFAALTPEQWSQDSLPWSTAAASVNDTAAGNWSVLATAPLGVTRAPGLQADGAGWMLGLTGQGTTGTGVAAVPAVQGLLRMPDVDLSSLRGDALLFTVSLLATDAGGAGVVVGDAYGEHVRLFAAGGTLGAVRHSVDADTATGDVVLPLGPVAAVGVGAVVALALRIEGRVVHMWANGQDLGPCTFAAPVSGGVYLFGDAVVSATFWSPCAVQVARQVGAWRLAEPPDTLAKLPPPEAWLTGGTVPGWGRRGALLPKPDGSAVWLLGDGSWSDYRATVQLQWPSSGSSASRLVLDWQDSANFVAVGRSGDSWSVEQWVDGAKSEQKIVETGPVGDWPVFVVTSTAGRVRVDLGDTQLYNAAARAWSGRVGLLFVSETQTTSPGPAPLACLSYTIEPATPVMIAQKGGWIVEGQNLSLADPDLTSGTLAMMVDLGGKAPAKLEFVFASEDDGAPWLLRIAASTAEQPFGMELTANKEVSWRAYCSPQLHQFALSWSDFSGLQVWLGGHRVLQRKNITGRLLSAKVPPVALPTFLSSAEPRMWLLPEVTLDGKFLFEDAFQFGPDSAWVSAPEGAWTYGPDGWTGTAGETEVTASIGDASWAAGRVALTVGAVAPGSRWRVQIGDSSSAHVVAKFNHKGTQVPTLTLAYADGALGDSKEMPQTVLDWLVPSAPVELECFDGLVSVRVAGKIVGSLRVPFTAASGQASLVVEAGSLTLTNVAVGSARWHDLVTLTSALNERIGERQVLGWGASDRIASRNLQPSALSAWPAARSLWMRAQNATDEAVHRRLSAPRIEAPFSGICLRADDGSVVGILNSSGFEQPVANELVLWFAHGDMSGGGQPLGVGTIDGSSGLEEAVLELAAF